MNPPDVTSKDRFLSSRQRYQEIVNKASCLSLVSNAILYWNTIKIAETVVRLRAQGEFRGNSRSGAVLGLHGSGGGA